MGGRWIMDLDASWIAARPERTGAVALEEILVDEPEAGEMSISLQVERCRPHGPARCRGGRLGPRAPRAPRPRGRRDDSTPSGPRSTASPWATTSSSAGRPACGECAFCRRGQPRRCKSHRPQSGGCTGLTAPTSRRSCAPGRTRRGRWCRRPPRVHVPDSCLRTGMPDGLCRRHRRDVRPPDCGRARQARESR